MHVERAFTRVEERQFLLNLADSEHGALHYSLDVISFLRVDHLVVTVLKLAVDVHILDVKTGQVLKGFFFRPLGVVLVHFVSVWVDFIGHTFYFDLFLKVVHGLTEL
jgi:hypothetical protein